MIAPLLLDLIDPAWAGPVQERQVLAAVRALAYDRKLADRSGAAVDVVVVHDDDASHAEAERIAGVLGRLGAFTIQDLAVTVDVVDSDTFLTGSVPADVLLLPAGLEDTVDDVVAAAAPRRLLVAGFTLAYLGRGAALVVVTNDDHLRLVVDLPASRAAGAAFSSQLLQLAELYP